MTQDKTPARKRGTLLQIARKSASRAPMELLHSVELTVLDGLEGDSRGRSKTRQVTVLSQDSWDRACEELGVKLLWTARRANFLITGVDLAYTAGMYLRIGDVILKITGETKPCERMDEAHLGLQERLEPAWRGGVTCQVIHGGEISVGDTVILET
jgi:MOSC domain-containing protein YiiM